MTEMIKLDNIRDYLSNDVFSTIKTTSKSKATDIVETSYPESNKFMDWFKEFFNGSTSDLDIFMSDTFPVRNMDIIMRDNGLVTTAEVRIADNVAIFKDDNKYDIYKDFRAEDIHYRATIPYKDMTTYLYGTDKYLAIVGTIRIIAGGFTVMYPIAIFNSCNNVGLLDYPLECTSKGKSIIGEIVDRKLMNEAYKMALWKMGEFTDINIALLNPYISVVIGESTTTTTIDDSNMKTTKKNDKKKKKPTHIRYIKKIRLGDISEKCVKRGITRHAQLWYVTGHWRTYQSGKRIFIQGYWKGALRETKNAEARIREMVYPTESPEKIE